MDEEDFKELKNCRAGHCQVQLPTEAMEEFQHSVNWSAPDAGDQANHLAQQMVLQALLNYEQGGNAALGTYRDKKHPSVVAETFASLLSRSKALPVCLPELREYLLNYPKADSSGIRSDFYWEKANFGLKPTLRVVQAIIYQGKAGSARGISPQAAHRSGREPLDSSGSCHPEEAYRLPPRQGAHPVAR